MSLVMEILEGMWNTTVYHKGARVNLFGVHMPFNKNSYQSTLSRLNTKGLIENVSGKWVLTKSGRKYFVDNRIYSIKFQSPVKNEPKNLLLMFDIPEIRKKERQWFRKYLKEFGFIMLQRSVWIGPSPLPKKFTDFVKEIKLDQCIRTFKLAKPLKK